MKNNKGLLVLFLALFLSNNTNAQLYRYIDNNGRISIGDSVPTQYIKNGYDILDNRFNVIRSFEPEPDIETKSNLYAQNIVDDIFKDEEQILNIRDQHLLYVYGDIAKIKEIKRANEIILSRNIQILQNEINNIHNDIDKLIKIASSNEFKGNSNSNIIKDYEEKINKANNIANNVIHFDVEIRRSNSLYENYINRIKFLNKK